MTRKILSALAVLASGAGTSMPALLDDSGGVGKKSSRKPMWRSMVLWRASKFNMATS